MKFFLKNSKILYLCFSLSSIVFSQELLLRKCNVPYLGTWVDLSTLNRFEFDSGCGFRFEGAGCTVSGEYFSSESSEGTTTLLNKVSPTHSTCFSKGEHSCTYSVYKNSLVLKCPTKQAITFVRQIRRAVSSLKGLSGTAKTLSLLQTGPPESLKSHLEQLSDEGAVEASSALGYNHFYGSRELKQDFSEALYWNRLAASQGSHISKVLVGTQYLYGLGVPTDKAKAEEFFLSAAKENDVVPQKALAGMYLMQPNKIKNREKAIYWLTQAVSLGDQQARDFLKGLKPEEEKNLRTFCALFEKVHDKKPALMAETPREAAAVVVAAPVSEAARESPRESLREIQNEKVSEGESPVTRVVTLPMEPARCLAAGYVPAAQKPSELKTSSVEVPAFNPPGFFWVGGGMTDLGIRSSRRAFDNIRFLVSFKTDPFLIWGGLNIQGNFDYALPFKSETNSLSFSQIEAKLSYDMPVSKTITLKPSFSYLRLQFEDSYSRLGIVGGQIGFGLASEILINSEWDLQLSGTTLAAGRGTIVSESETLNRSLMMSNYNFGLFLRRNSGSGSSYGLSLQVQQISLSATPSDPTQLSQYSGQFFYHF